MERKELPTYAVFDDYRYSQLIAVVVRWFLLSAWLFLLNYRSDLLSAVRSAAKGGSLLNPAVTTRVLARLKDLTTKEQDREVALLSEREREVLTLVAQGLTRRSEAATFAAQHGLLKEEGPREG